MAAVGLKTFLRGRVRSWRDIGRKWFLPVAFSGPPRNVSPFLAPGPSSSPAARAFGFYTNTWKVANSSSRHPAFSYLCPAPTEDEVRVPRPARAPSRSYPKAHNALGSRT